jgi:uncharacterized surface protein with fasciclin (FAS1) repeats
MHSRAVCGKNSVSTAKKIVSQLHPFLNASVASIANATRGSSTMALSRRSLIAAVVLSLTSAGPVLAQQSRNIVETAAGAGQFQTLLAAARAAGLVEALSGPGPLTVFAPTDAAFKRLPAGTVETLLKPENRDQLRAILTYHVLPARVAARDVPHKATLVTTLNANNRVRVVRSKGVVHVDRARVIKADISTSNGVIHVINRVLIPGQRRG